VRSRVPAAAISSAKYAASLSLPAHAPFFAWPTFPPALASIGNTVDALHMIKASPGGACTFRQRTPGVSAGRQVPQPAAKRRRRAQSGQVARPYRMAAREGCNGFRASLWGCCACCASWRREQQRAAVAGCCGLLLLGQVGRCGVLILDASQRNKKAVARTTSLRSATVALMIPSRPARHARR
jgi:hypothetical protein